MVFLGDEKQDGWINFCDALSYSRDLSCVRVGHLGLSSVQIELFLQIFTQKTLPLMFLDLSYSSIDKIVAPLLITALKNIPNLIWLCIDGIEYLPEVDEYLKTRADIKVEWT
jgi:hypothetical protein